MPGHTTVDIAVPAVALVTSKPVFLRNVSTAPAVFWHQLNEVTDTFAEICANMICWDGVSLADRGRETVALPMASAFGKSSARHPNRCR